jgi:Domain of unknown function (DUF4169)
MGEIVNLRRARKTRERRKDEEQAQENRVIFGLSKAERQFAEKAKTLAERRLEGHRLEVEFKPESGEPK